MTRLFALTAAVIALPACGDSPTAVDLIGDWGGEHVALTITPGGGSLEFDCAHGTIDEPIRPAANGTFDAAGVYVREHGGPIREDEPPDSHPARYRGRVDGSRMTLTVTLTDGEEWIAQYALTQGAPARVYKCLQQVRYPRHPALLGTSELPTAAVSPFSARTGCRSAGGSH